LRYKFYFRYTLNNIDLNRDFPDYLGAALPSTVRALETTAVMSWLRTIPFVLSANYHGGAFIINIPYDRYCKKLIIFFSKNKNLLRFFKILEKYHLVLMMIYIK
jgi:hypothetical protein